MSENNASSNTRPATSRLPRWVYRGLVGLAAWFGLAAWIFAGPSVTDYLLAIISGFIFVAVTLVLVLSRVARSDEEATDEAGPSGADAAQEPEFRDRATWDVDVFQARLSMGQAATQILLPLATAAFGMTAIGIALHIAEHMSPLAS